MSFQIQGTLHKKFNTEQKSQSFQAREFVIKIDDQKYPQLIKFQLTQDRCDLIDNVSEGDTINVHFDLRGREWNDKYFTNLNAWKIEPGTEIASDEQWPEPSEENLNQTSDSSGYEEDYPF